MLDMFNVLVCNSVSYNAYVRQALIEFQLPMEFELSDGDFDRHREMNIFKGTKNN